MRSHVGKINICPNRTTEFSAAFFPHPNSGNHHKTGSRSGGHMVPIWVRGGTLLAEGQLDNPITFSGDRLENEYSDTPAVGPHPESDRHPFREFGQLLGSSGIWLCIERSSAKWSTSCCRRPQLNFGWTAWASVQILHWTSGNMRGSPKLNPLECSRNPEDIRLFQQFVFHCGAGLRLLPLLGGKIEMHLSTFANLRASTV